MRKTKEFYRGCLVGGAIGDSLGWPVELLSLEEIKNQFGESGISNLICKQGKKAEVTDDTQMTLFTAEGLLRAESRGMNKGSTDVTMCVYHAYLRWLYTQGYNKLEDKVTIYDGWLMKEKALYVRRSPGESCLSSLQSGIIGCKDKPINDSKGCGGVMRMAPVGLFYRRKLAINKGIDFAAITHGHRLGYLTAGALAYIISAIIEGMSIQDSVEECIEVLKEYSGSEELVLLLNRASELSKSKKVSEIAIAEIGEGEVAEEVLAISVYCALKYNNSFEKAVIAAVNHSGNSDSTGAITGNIIGASLGMSKIPLKWVKNIELLNIINKIADDLYIGYSDEREWWIKYPGY